MPQLLIALVILYFGYKIIKWAARTPPATFARLIRSVGGKRTISQKVFVMATKRGPLGLIAASLFNLWLDTGKKNAGEFSPAGAGRSARVSRAQSQMLRMELDLDSGAMCGGFIDGPNAGRSLENFSQNELVRALNEDLRNDAEGRRLLEAYLDRMFVSWRGDFRGSAGDNAMTPEEAYAILGLGPGASRENISQAYRTLMKKAHPDYGGTDEQAMRLTQARAILLKSMEGSAR